MIHTFIRPAAVVIALAFAPTGLAAEEAPAPAAAPTFEGWTVKSDDVIPAAKTEAVAKKLGAKITALRNTVYDVKGEKVQINVMTVADAAEGDKLVAAITKTKAPWSCVRKDTTVYELVGSNKAMDAMKKASASLSAR